MEPFSMQSRVLSVCTRLACVLSVTTLLVFGHIGCGGGSSTETGTADQLPPEAKEANKNMQDFMKTQKPANAKKR
jgi:hypothetical protein